MSENPGKPIHKWQVFRQICEAKSALRASDRALAVLNALLSFHPDTVLTAGAADLIVFPSNRQLAVRAHGIAASTLRRHLAVLVEAGLVLRRDSPNGKRYARKASNGDVEQAFGFDLGPVIARAEEFAALAGAISKERQALDMLRQQITLARRDIAKMITAGVAQDVAGDWASHHQAFRDILVRIPRVPTAGVLEPVLTDLNRLAAVILNILEQHVDQTESGTTESHFGRNIQSSNIEAPIESEPGFPESRPTISASYESTRRVAEAVPVGLIVQACPDLVDYARRDIRSSRDVIDAASIVRPLLGISPSAWEEACATMGEGQASVVVAAILQRGAAIKNPGGYFRTLARRAAEDRFSIWPMIMALLSARRSATGAAKRGSTDFALPDESS